MSSADHFVILQRDPSHCPLMGSFMRCLGSCCFLPAAKVRLPLQQLRDSLVMTIPIGEQETCSGPIIGQRISRTSKKSMQVFKMCS